MLNNIFESLYKNIDGSSLSWEARNKLTDKEIEHLVYGEVDFDALSKIYKIPSIQNYLKKAENFCDLGSGTGKIVFGSALLLDNCKKYCGIELLKELYYTSNDLIEKFYQEKKDFNKEISFINDDFFNIDLSDYDIIFMHYPMKNAEDLYLKLEEKMKNELKKNTLIISAIRKLKNLNTFPLIDKQKIEANYGDSTIYFHIKYN